MKKIWMLIFILFCFTNVIAQKKKSLKENEISSKIEWQFEYKNGVEEKYKEAEYKYDQTGNVLMEKTYDEKGSIVKYFEYEYDNNGNQIVQITYNPKGRVEKREEFKYQGKLKVEKRTFGSDGKLKSKKIYEYKTFAEANDR